MPQISGHGENSHLPTVPDKTLYPYQAFLSYSTRHDYTLARRLEAFLESLHRTPVPSGSSIRPLRICRDGSDFRLPRQRPTAPAAEDDPIWAIIRERLSECRYILVLCSESAAKSPWVDREVRWFLENRGPGSILLALTSGEAPLATPESVFPPSVVEANLHERQIWYDLRQGRVSLSTVGLRDFDDERVRLGSDLLEWDEAVQGPLLTLWQREELRKKRRSLLIAVLIGLALILLSAWAVVERRRAIDRLVDTQLGAARLLTLYGRFSEAAALLQDLPDDEPRVRLARWFVRQHEPHPVKVSPAFTRYGIPTLAMDSKSGVLAAIVRRRDRKAELLAIDPERWAVLGRADLPEQVEGLVPGKANRTFLAFGEGGIFDFGLRGGHWQLATLEVPPAVEEIQLCTGQDLGLAVRDGQLVPLVREGDAFRIREALRTVPPGSRLAAADDGLMIGLAAPPEAETEEQSLVQGVGHFSAAFLCAAGQIEPMEVLDGTFPLIGRLLGRGTVASLTERDTLNVVRAEDGLTVETRPILYQPWLGLAVSRGEALLVQEVGDTSLEVAAKLAVLELGTGQDLLEGSVVEEPIWAFASDDRHGLVFLAGQSGRISRIGGSPRVLSRARNGSFESPVRTLGNRLLIRNGNALEGELWELDVQTAQLAQLSFRDVLSFDVSPGGTEIALGGSGAVEVRSQASRAVRRFDSKEQWTSSLAYDSAGLRMAVGDMAGERLSIVDAATLRVQRIFNGGSAFPIDSLRWIGKDFLLAGNYHKEAVLLDRRTGSQHVLDLRGDAVTHIAPRGPGLISTLSGNIWRVDESGKLRWITRRPDLRTLLPLDNQGIYYVGQAEQPLRTAFLAWTGDGLEEVTAFPSSELLQDAVAVNGRVVLLYRRFLRVYPVSLPADADMVPLDWRELDLQQLLRLEQPAQ